MARVPVAPVVALPRQRDIETTADLDKGPGRRRTNGEEYGYQVLSMTAAVSSSAARSAAATADLPCSRDSSTVACAPEWFMRSALNSSLARQLTPSSWARAKDRGDPADVCSLGGALPD
jgi:hypothetical protein